LTQFRPSSALDKVEERDGKFYYQNVALTNFNDAKESAKVSKSKLLEKIMREMQTRMEAAENKYVLMAATILNCKDGRG
jgi:hypothetical protein